MQEAQGATINYRPDPADPGQGQIGIPGVTIAAARAPDRVPYEFTFSSTRHTAVFSFKGSRAAGETRLSDAPTSTSLSFQDTCLVVPAGGWLRGWSAPRSTHEYVVVSFDPSLQAGLDRGFATLAMRPALCFEDRLLTAAGRALQLEASGATRYGALWTGALTNMMLIRLLVRDGGSGAVSAQARGGLGPSNLRVVQDYMLGQLGENTSLTELAGLVGLSVSHFSRAFRTSTGMPPHLWLRHRRTERAQDLLRSTDLAITDVAAVCGFADQSHLTKVFRALVGVTPLRWRRDGAKGPELH